ncbi:MAG: glycosyltransferase family 4 protein [Rhodothermaceae bacterium]|nr:glycosyltransferase family 4 protein [Rhodothermaceae bacterium]MYF63021.1 glycosyltransferase family 4 protein [Rhodothermaceae bacterium]MYI84968.1 glycosyltransferase family 4 protein [Rhodothermaceae bacterium]
MQSSEHTNLSKSVRQSVDITFALTGDPRVNSRALRQLRLLSELGLKILVLGLGTPVGVTKMNIKDVTLMCLPRPNGSGPRFFWRNHRQFKSALKYVKSKVYHASDLYTLPAMRQAADRQRARLVFDARELYTHLPSSARRPWVRATWEVIQHLHIHRANCVYTVSESIARHLQKKHNAQNICLMRNIPAPQAATPTRSLRERLALPPDVTIILHQGNLQKHRGATMMVEAMLQTDNAVLVFMGHGPMRSDTEHLVENLGLHSKVRFIDPVPPDKLLSVTASADVGLTFLEDCCLNHRYALPNKLFEYLAAGVPVVSSDLPEISQIIQRFNVGCVVPPGSTKALAAALSRAVSDTELRKTWAANTPDVQKVFNFTTESECFTAAYLALLNG